MLPTTVLLRIEFTATDSLQPSGALLPHLSTLTSSAQVPDPAPHRLRQGALPTPRLLSPEKLAFFRVPLLGMRRYLSVALFLKSPSAGVTRYPCPVEPGLSSRPAFRPGRATVCLTRLSILAESDGIVNAWPQCGLHIGGSRQGLPLKIPDGPQSAARSRLHGPAALGEKVWEGEGRGCIFFRSAV